MTLHLLSSVIVAARRMTKYLRILIRPEPMTPAQRRARLIFWSGVMALGVLIWFLADLIPQHPN